MQTVEPQDEIVRRYCSEAADAIESAKDAASARVMVESFCSRFSAECSSDLIVHASRQYLTQRLRDRWPEETP